MKNDLKIKEMYDKRAKSYDKILSRFGYHKTVKAITEAIELRIPDKARILDVGCGTGLATEILIERFPNAKISGLDCSEKMLMIYTERFSRAKAIIGDFNNDKGFYYFNSRNKVKLKNMSFDLVVSTGAVSEYGEKEVVIPFIYRLLKKNGIFINIGIRKNIMSAMTGRVWKYKPMGRENLSSLCKLAGFNNIKNIKIPWVNFPNNIMKFCILAKK